MVAWKGSRRRRGYVTAQVFLITVSQEAVQLSLVVLLLVNVPSTVGCRLHQKRRGGRRVDDFKVGIDVNCHIVIEAVIDGLVWDV